MEPNQKRVREFHLAFGQPAPEKFTPLRDPGSIRLRVRLILEEALEFCAATGSKLYCNSNGRPLLLELDKIVIAVSGTVGATDTAPNDAEMIDALCDIKYVVDGTAVALGIDLEDFDKEVHASNMSKLSADGKPIVREDGKVLKSTNFRPPDIAGLLAKIQSS